MLPSHNGVATASKQKKRSSHAVRHPSHNNADFILCVSPSLLPFVFIIFAA